jgi:hypothetical protein
MKVTQQNDALLVLQCRISELVLAADMRMQCNKPVLRWSVLHYSTAVDRFARLYDAGVFFVALL